MTFEKDVGLHYNKRKDQPQSKAQKPKEDSPEQIVQYLENKYGVIIPDGFLEKLDSAYAKFHGTKYVLTCKKVDAVVSACWKWDDYVEDLNSLICNEVLSMAEIHVSVIWARSLTKNGYALKKAVPNCRQTIVNVFGVLRMVSL